MKNIIMALALTTLCGIVKAQERTLFEGVDRETGFACSLSVEAQNREANMYTVIYRTEGKELRFYNEIIPGNPKSLTTNGLFQKSQGEYNTIIGTPIFALGSYYEVDLKANAKGVRLDTTVRLAAIVTWITISESTEICD